jgi:hypothetical protein
MSFRMQRACSILILYYALFPFLPSCVLCMYVRLYTENDLGGLDRIMKLELQWQREKSLMAKKSHLEGIIIIDSIRKTTRKLLRR